MAELSLGVAEDVAEAERVAERVAEETGKRGRHGWPRPPCPSLRSAGMSLIELLLTLVILGLLLGVAAPDFAGILQRNRAELAMARLQGLVEFTRLTAVTTGRETTLCPSADGRHCGGSWRQGALVFSNPDRARQPDADGPLRVLRFSALPGRLLWRAFGNRQSLTYTPLGFTRNQNGSFTYCPDDHNLRNARILVINRAGRVRRARDNDGDGIVEDSRGGLPRCD